MSQSDDGRDLAAELNHPTAGEYGRAVEAICTECKNKRGKFADVDPDGPSSFRHVCHNCQKETFWNVVEFVRASELEWSE